MSSRSKKEVIEAIKSASKLNSEELLIQRTFFANSDITISDVLRYFPKWSDACRAAGVKYDTSRDRKKNEDLLSDWGQVCRALGHVPRLTEYKVHGKYSRTVFNRFGSGLWQDVPEAFKEFATGNDEWEDVLKILRKVTLKPKKKKKPLKIKVFNDGSWHNKIDNRPVYGNPIDFRGLRHEPVNEQGVVFLFGMVAKELKYLVEAIQGGFPDCEAKREVSRGKWQTVRIEFEYASKNFEEHGHDPEGCDVIICWMHNWPDCPENLEVIALSDLIEKL